MNRRHWERAPAGMVVAGVIERVRDGSAPYPWYAWESFLVETGLRWVLVPLPDIVSAFVWERSVYLRAGMGAREMACAAWHEAGHVLLHAGGYHHWIGCPQGRLTVAKFECQARQFANWFPVWGEE